MEYHKSDLEYQKTIKEVIHVSPWILKFFGSNNDLPYHLAFKFFERLENFFGGQFYIDAKVMEFEVDSELKRVVEDLSMRGIISSCRRAKQAPDWPKFVNYTFKLNTIITPSGKARGIQGSLGGNSILDHNEALRKGIAEVLERYSLCVYDDKKIIYGSYDEIRQKKAVDPQKFKCFSQKQLENQEVFKNHDFNRKSRFGWIEGVSLFDNEKYLMPAQLSYILYEFVDGEPQIRQTTTNGAAAGDSWERAAYAAICEAVERDALMILWLNRLSPKQIDLNALKSERIQNLLEKFRRYNLEIYAFDITSDIKLPVVLAITIDRSGKGPAVHFATDCELNIEEAIYDSLLGCIAAGPWIMNLMTKENFKRVNDIAPNFSAIRDRAIFWAQKKLIKKIDFLFNSDAPKIKFSDSELYKFSETGWKEKFAEVKTILNKAQLECYLVDATSPLARSLGISVIMSLIPGLYPLYLSEKFKYLGIDRLYETPVKLGYLNQPKKEEEMNPLPHPFL